MDEMRRIINKKAGHEVAHNLVGEIIWNMKESYENTDLPYSRMENKFKIL